MPPARWRRPASKGRTKPSTSSNASEATSDALSPCLTRTGLLHPPALGEFMGQILRSVNLVDCFQDRGRVHRGGAPLFVVEGVVPGQALQVAVENNPHELPGPVDHGAARIAADDVVGADE